MGVSYAISSFVSIIAKYEKNGLTWKEILELNEKEYKAKIKEHFIWVHPTKKLGYLFTGEYVIFKNGKYYLKPKAKINPELLEYRLKDAEDWKPKKILQ